MRVRRNTFLGAAAGIGLAAIGCAVHIRPPPAPANPVKVYLADYGYHASLILPRGDDVAAEYSYGEWEWYANGRTEWYRAAPVLLLPSRGTLGTRDLPRPRTNAELARHAGVEESLEIIVDAESCRDLLERLDQRFKAGAEHCKHNSAFDLSFVPDPQPYWLFWQCNTAVASWLRELGCEVRGCALDAKFVLDSAPAASQPATKPSGA